MNRIKLFTALLLSVVMLVVVLQNTEAVETRILFASITMPRALLIAVAFLAGTIAGLLLAAHFGRRASKNRESRDQKSSDQETRARDTRE